jgi:hypothetical protein
MNIPKQKIVNLLVLVFWEAVIIGLIWTVSKCWQDVALTVAIALFSIHLGMVVSEQVRTDPEEL